MSGSNSEDNEDEQSGEDLKNDVEDNENGTESEGIVNDGEEESIVEPDSDDWDAQEISAEKLAKIKDPHVKALLTLNTKEEKIEDVISVLMSNPIYIKPKLEAEKKKANEEKLKKRMKKNNPYQNTVSCLKSYLSSSKAPDNDHKYSKTDKFHIYREDDDPEFTTDFKHATQKVWDKMVDEKKDQDVMNVLFSSENKKKDNKEKHHQELTREEIGNKVEQALLKKQVNLEKIANRCNDKYNETYTFTPVLTTGNTEKRTLTQFLEDQENHTKKKIDKVNKGKEDIKEKESWKNPKPTIDKNSQAIFEKTIKDKQDAYLRLYNKKYQTAKTNFLKDKDKDTDKPKKEDLKQTELKKQFEAKMKDNKYSSKYHEKVPKIKEDVAVPPKKRAMYQKDIKTNDMIYTSFNNDYNTKSKLFFDSLLEIRDDEPNTNSVKLDKFSLEHLFQFLPMLYMISKRPHAQIGDCEQPIPESSIHQTEKKLVTELWETLKNEEGMVETKHLKEILTCVLGLRPYQWYKNYKNNHNDDDYIALTKDIKEQDEKLEAVIQAEEKEELEKINENHKGNNKYVSYDNDNNLIICLAKAKTLKKRFHFLCLNYITTKPSLNTHMEKWIEKYYNKRAKNQPQWNPNSWEMSKKYRNRIINKEDNESEQVESQKTNPHWEYINQIVMKRKKQLAENQKKKEQLVEKELAVCTFKPKILDTTTITKASGANRFNEMFQKGSEKEKNRKNASQIELEFERNKHECTFKPNMLSQTTPVPSAEITFEETIGKDPSYLYYKKRMEIGWKERQIKESINERGAIDNKVLKEYIKEQKKLERELQQSNMNAYNNCDINNTSKNNSNNNSTTNNPKKRSIVQSTEEEETKGDKNGDIQTTADVNNNNINNDNNGDMEKREGIPLLIIDVNIRKGEKKKIFVYEGDTAEGLAEKFSTEHNWEPQTQDRLQNLIHEHMVRLLTKIEEESQSEKSGTTHQMHK